MREPSSLPQLRRLVRRVDELELLLARMHRMCAVELGVYPRGTCRRRRSVRPRLSGKEGQPAREE